MRIKNNEIIVSKGETFTFDRIVKYRDGSPFIVSSELKDAYFLLTVASSVYEQDNRYVYNKWLDLKSYPKFYFTQPIDLRSIKNAVNGDSLYTNFNDITSLTDYSWDGDVIETVATGYIGDEFFILEPEDAVFYIEEDGKKIYKYWDRNLNDWSDYNCRIITTFNNNITKDWVEQEYVYSIRLVTVSNDSVKEIQPILLPSKLTVLSNIQNVNNGGII